MLAKQPIKNGVETTHISIKGIANTGHPERMRKNISTVNGQYKIQLYNESRKDRGTVLIHFRKINSVTRIINPLLITRV